MLGLGLSTAAIRNATVIKSKSSQLDYVTNTGRLDGTLYSSKDLVLLENYLKKRGIELKIGDKYLPANKGGAFNAETGTIILKDNPTRYEVLHEVSHYIQYKNIGKGAYKTFLELEKLLILSNSMHQNNSFMICCQTILEDGRVLRKRNECMPIGILIILEVYDETYT